MVRRVVLIDDDAAVLESLEAVFLAADFEVSCFGSAGDFLAALPDLSPACIVTDMRMPGMDGLTLATKLTVEMRLPWPIIVISGHADISEAVAAMRAGAVDFLIKPFPPQKLVAIVRASLSAMSGQKTPDTDVDQRYATLSERERQVVELLIAGGSSKTAGLDLGISPRTVDVFRGRSMKKMGVANIASLATAVAAVSPNVRDMPKTT